MSYFVDARQAVAAPPKQRMEIWGPGIAQGNLIQVVGPRGVMKSRFVMALTMSMAHRQKFLCWPTAMRTVLYWDGELGTDSMSSRVWETIQALGVEGFYELFRFVPYDKMGDRSWNLSDPVDQGRFEDVIDESGSHVVVFDNLLTMSRAMNERDSDFAQWERIQPWFSRLRNKGLTIILVHHTGKDATRGGLGTSTREVTLDAVIALQPTNSMRSEFELHWTKRRDFTAQDTPPILVEYIKGEDGLSRWYWKPLGEDLDRRILEMNRSGMTRAQIARELGIPYSRVSQVVPREWKQDGFPNI